MCVDYISISVGCAFALFSSCAVAAGDVWKPTLRALMQMTHVNVTRQRLRLEGGLGDRGVLRLTQIMTLDGAMHQEASRDEMVDAGLVAHEGVGLRWKRGDRSRGLGGVFANQAR